MSVCHCNTHTGPTAAAASGCLPQKHAADAVWKMLSIAKWISTVNSVGATVLNNTNSQRRNRNCNYDRTKHVTVNCSQQKKSDTQWDKLQFGYGSSEWCLIQACCRQLWFQAPPVHQPMEGVPKYKFLNKPTFTLSIYCCLRKEREQWEDFLIRQSFWCLY